MKEPTAAVLSIALSTICLADTWTVDDDGKADFSTIQAAIDASSNGDEIIVSPGTYFESINYDGKQIGIHGNGSISTTIDGSKNFAPVVTFSSEDPTSSLREGSSLLEGFFITGGTGTPFLDPVFGLVLCGGGIYVEMSSPSILNCVIEENAAWGGAGMFVTQANPTVSGCTFRGNSSEGHGGGIYAIDFANPTITDCLFDGNSANWGAGITCTIYSDANIISCIFAMNTTFNTGGGIFIRSRSSPIITDSDFLYNNQINNPIGAGGGITVYGSGSGGGPCYPTITGCLFEGNTVTGDGGGLAAAYDAHPKLVDCTFRYNVAGRSGGGLACVADPDHTVPSNADVQGCVFEYNSSDEEGGGIHCRNSDPIINGAIVHGNTAGTTGGGINFFESPAAELSNSMICENSPNQLNGGFTDLGNNSISDECENCEGDANGDGDVGVTDLLAVIDQWGQSNAPADFNNDGIVNVTDLLIVVGNWGPCE
jgi:predicted outer membrane repeat protein